MKRHSIIPIQTKPARSGDFPFQIRDLGYNGEGLSSGYKFKLIGDMNYWQDIRSLVHYGPDKCTVSTPEMWKELGPLAKKYFRKVLEFTKVL